MRIRRTDKNTNSGKLIGALFGFGLFTGSFFLLWSNEGRINFGEVAQESISISAASPSGAEPGQLVAAVGDLDSPELLGDPLFLNPEEYIYLERTVEMYAWDEDEETEDDQTYYEYRAEWAEYPDDSSQFYDTSYYNPPMPFSSQTFTVSSASVGALNLDARALEYPEPQPLNITQDMLLPVADNQDVTLTGGYIYIGFRSLNDPDIGDIRVSYGIIPHAANVTIFGQISGDQLLPYPVEDEAFYRLFFINRESAIEQMQEEYITILWATRFGGFSMMWCGLFLLLNPLTILVSLIPALERAGSWLLILLALPFAAVASIITITVSFLAHNIWILIILILLIFMAIGAVAFGLYLFNKRKQAA